MNTLKFEVYKNTLKRRDGFNPVLGEKNYTKIKCYFVESDWDKCTAVTANFMSDKDNIVKSTVSLTTDDKTAVFDIPSDIDGDKICFSLTGSYADDSGNTVTLNTNLVGINRQKGMLPSETVNFELYEQMLSLYNKMNGLYNQLKDEKISKSEGSIVTAYLADGAVTKAKLSSDLNTLASYGITDAYTKEKTDQKLARKLDSMPFDDKPKQNSPCYLTSGTIYNALLAKADKASTLAGYGIANAYSKTEIDTKLSGKLENTAGSVTTDNIVNKAVTAEKLSDDVTNHFSKLKDDIVNNNEMLAYGETMLDMKWQQGYWYSIINGEYNIATPQENYVACKYKIEGDGSNLIATKQNGHGFTMFVCEYDLNDVFIKGYQYGNTVLNMKLERGKKYAFSISSSANVTVESATANYIFFKSVNIIETNKKLKNYIDFGNIYYIGATRELTTLREGLKKACEKKNSIVYVDAGIYDIAQEYGNDYFKNYSYSSSDCGIVLKNNVNVIFSPKSKVLCNYTGNNHDAMFYFSPFNVGEGGFRVENLNIECSRVRYCMHDDLGMFGNSHDFTKTEYQSCSMFLDNSQNTARKSNNCIGGGLPYNGEVVINGCIFESTAASPGYGGVDYHQNGADGAKSKSLITNCYFKGRYDRYSCSNLGQTKEKSTVIVANCSSGRTCGYAKNEQYTDSIDFLTWNNIRRPD